MSKQRRGHSEKETISAIMEKDLEALLLQTGQYMDFVNKELRCENCGRIISQDNIAIMLPQKEDDKLLLRFWCDQMDCVSKFSENYGK